MSENDPQRQAAIVVALISSGSAGLLVLGHDLQHGRADAVEIGAVLLFATGCGLASLNVLKPRLAARIGSRVATALRRALAPRRSPASSSGGGLERRA